MHTFWITVFGKCSLPVCALSSNSVYIVSCGTEVLNFNDIQLIDDFIMGHVFGVP